MNDPLSRVRKNHALEHATIAVLFEHRGRMSSVAGLSDPWGFSVWGRFTRDEVEAAAHEALRRLREGEDWLAITNNCGSNIVVAGLLTSFAALSAARRGLRDWQPAASAAMVALVAAQPVGRYLQKTVTTDPHVDALNIVSVSANGGGRRVRVSTRMV